MKIGELAKRSGMATSRIRFYESNGLIQTVLRQANGYREYPPETLTVLEIITSAQKAGFALDEIRSLLPADMSSWEHEKLIDALEQKVGEIDALEKRLSQNKAHLIALIEDVRNRPEGLDCAGNAKRLLGRMREGVSAMASTESDDASQQSEVGHQPID